MQYRLFQDRVHLHAFACISASFVQVGCCKQHSWSRIATELFLGAVKFVGGVVGWYSNCDHRITAIDNASV